MNKRILGIVVLLAVAVALLWTLRARTSTTELAEPAHVESTAQPVDTAPLTPSEPAQPARQSVESSHATEGAAADQAPAASTFALIKVLVVNKTTRAPMSGIEVDSSYDVGVDGRAIKQTTSSHGKPFETLSTDEKGRVEIVMPPNVESRVYATGMKQDAGADHATVSPLKPGEVREITLEIPTGNDMPFWMKLIDDPSQAPIVGASIGAGTGGDSSTKSDERGLVFLECRTWAPGLLHVEADGYSRAYLKPEPGHTQSDTALVVALAKCATVRVHVVDGAGHAIANAKVDLKTEGYNLGTSGGENSLDLISMEDPHWRGVTDDAGRTTISCVPAHIAIRAGITSPNSWNAPDELVFEPGETHDVEWKLSDGCDVHGLVLDQTNAPVTKREMWMRKAERKMPVYFGAYSNDETRKAMTDEEGRFRFTDVGAGTWWLGPGAPEVMAKIPSDDVAAAAQVVEIVDGQSDLDVTVRVDRGLFIRGTVLDAKGAPTKGGYVSGYDSANKLSAGVNLMPRDNVFAIGPLMKGHYVLTAHGYGGDADSDPVEADAGAEGVVLRLRTGASMSGTVLGPTGEPVTAKIWMAMRDSTKFGVHGVSCDNRGAFHIDALEAGTYDVAASASDGATGLLEGVVVASGEAKTGLSIRLAPGGHVRVRHEGPDRYINIDVLSHGVVVDLDGVERSTSHEFAAPAGSVVVRATYYGTDKRVVERTVDVKPGQTVDVVFEKDAH